MLAENHLFDLTSFNPGLSLTLCIQYTITLEGGVLIPVYNAKQKKNMTAPCSFVNRIA